MIRSIYFHITYAHHSYTRIFDTRTSTQSELELELELKSKTIVFDTLSIMCSEYVARKRAKCDVKLARYLKHIADLETSSAQHYWL